MNRYRAFLLSLGVLTLACGDATDEIVGQGGSGATGGSGGATSSGTAGSGGVTTGGGGTGGNTGGGGTGGGTPAQCSLGCHGSIENPAPPEDVFGNTATTEVTVGAHQAHVIGSDWHRDVQCDDCHIVPQVAGPDPNVPTHMNGEFDVVWGLIAGASANFDEGAESCSAVYCHGSELMADLPGATTVREPIWTQVDGSQSTCGASCHTTPPGGFHPEATACDGCHGDTIASFSAGNPPQATFADADLHINGEVNTDSGLKCTGCHGDQNSGNPAPPRGTAGEMQTSDAAVGAHQAHLGAANWHRQVLCSDCHAIPQTMLHLDGTTDFNWSAVAAADGASPQYDMGNNTCNSVYCHGTTLYGPNGGGTVSRQPIWTVVNGTYDSCGNTCHTNPPGDAHPASTACASCHPVVVSSYTPGNPPTVVWNNASLHINGSVDMF